MPQQDPILIQTVLQTRGFGLLDIYDIIFWLLPGIIWKTI